MKVICTIEGMPTPLKEYHRHHRRQHFLVNIMSRHHTHDPSPNQCGSSLVRTINAPLPLVWSVIRRFGHPQAYKKFVKSCTLSSGNGAEIGSVREVEIVSGLPAEKSTERLDRLDEESHVVGFSIIGGDHRLLNYKSTTSVHEADGETDDGEGKTVVTESYVVDIPADSCEEDTRLFADTIVGCNLNSLAYVMEKMACEL